MPYLVEPVAGCRRKVATGGGDCSIGKIARAVCLEKLPVRAVRWAGSSPVHLACASWRGLGLLIDTLLSDTSQNMSICATEPLPVRISIKPSVRLMPPDETLPSATTLPVPLGRRLMSLFEAEMMSALPPTAPCRPSTVGPRWTVTAWASRTCRTSGASCDLLVRLLHRLPSAPAGPVGPVGPVIGPGPVWCQRLCYLHHRSSTVLL